MDARTILLRILTPSGTAFSGEVASVVLPAAGGSMGVLPGHVPLLALLSPGTLSFRPSASSPERSTAGALERSSFSISSGFAEVGPDRVTVLVDSAAGA